MNGYRWVIISALIALIAVPAYGQAAKAQEKSATVQNAPESAKAAAPAGPVPVSGQYKIGIINRKKVFRGYNKVKAEYERLEQEVKKLQVPIDELLEKANKAKEKYDKEKETLSVQERSARELEIETMQSEYKRLLQANQDKIDAQEAASMKTVFSEIDAAVAKLAESESYHLILDGGDTRGTVYFSPTLDITQKVVDILNSGK